MYSKELTLRVDASPEAVYDYLSDFKRHPEWAAQPMEIEVEGANPVQPGTKFSSKVKYMSEIEAKGGVLEAQRPLRLMYESRDSSGHWRWTFEIKPDDGGTLLTHHLDRLSTPLYVNLMSFLTWPLMGKKMVIGGLANIKSRLETGVRVS